MSQAHVDTGMPHHTLHGQYLDMDAMEQMQESGAVGTTSAAATSSAAGTTGTAAVNSMPEILGRHLSVSFSEF